jgi:hypothetical protein
VVILLAPFAQLQGLWFAALVLNLYFLPGTL